MNFQNVLKTRRKQLGYTLKEIAERIGVTEATVQRWESGNIKNLRHERLSKLAEVLEIHPAVLMGWTENSDSIKITPQSHPETQQMLVFNWNGIEGVHSHDAPSDEALNEINKLVKILQLCPVHQITALLRLVENGGNIPLQSDITPELKELLETAAKLPEDKLKALIQFCKTMNT